MARLHRWALAFLGFWVRWSPQLGRAIVASVTVSHRADSRQVVIHGTVTDGRRGHAREAEFPNLKFAPTPRRGPGLTCSAATRARRSRGSGDMQRVDNDNAQW